MEFAGYLIMGALFAVAASLALKRGTWHRLAGVTVGTALLLLLIGLWLESKARPSETDIGFPILLSILSPALAGAAIWLFEVRGSSVVVQSVMGTFAWALGFVVTSIAALYLNWITF